MNHTSTEAPLITVLRSSVISKINSDWENWRKKGHGTQYKGIEALPSKRAFYIDLQVEIRNTLAENLGSVQASELMPSEDTLIGFFEPKKVRTFRTGTLKALSIYAGFKSYAEFRAKYAHLEAPPSFALVHIKRVHQNSKSQSNVPVLRRRSTHDDAGADNASDIVDVTAYEIKPWYRSKWGFVFLPPILGLGLYLFFRQSPEIPVSLATKKQENSEIPFNKLVIEPIDKSNTHMAGSTVLYRFDYSELGVDTLKLKFETPVSPRELVLTKPIDTIPLHFDKTATTIEVSAGDKSESIARPMGGYSEWHYMLVNMGVKYENVHYLDISYDQIRNPEIMRKGAIVLPTNTVSKYFPRTQTSLLSSFGLFPEVNLNHFSLEYRVRFSEKPLLIGQMYAGIYNKSDLAIEVPLSDSAFAMYDYFHFKQHIPIEKAKIPEVFVVPRNDRWNTVRMDVNNRHCDVYINNKLNYSTPVPVLTDSLLWGLEMQFASETELDYIRFTDPQGKLLYAQEFNDPETMNLLEPGKLVYQKLCGAKAKP